METITGNVSAALLSNGQGFHVLGVDVSTGAGEGKTFANVVGAGLNIALESSRWRPSSPALHIIGAFWSAKGSTPPRLATSSVWCWLPMTGRCGVPSSTFRDGAVKPPVPFTN